MIRNYPHCIDCNIKLNHYSSTRCRKCESIRKHKTIWLDRIVWNKGIKNIKQSGSNHWNWKGGIVNLNRNIRNSFEYKKWRSDIFERDYWTCLTCHKRGGNLEVHHIKKFIDILNEHKIQTVKDSLKCKELWDEDNGITLCKFCHNLTKRK